MIPFHDEDFHSYTFVQDDGPVARFEVSNVYQDKGAIWGEISVRYLFGGADEPIIAYKRLNILNEKRPGMDDLMFKNEGFPWDEWYEQVTRLTVDATREPPEPERMVAARDRTELAPFLLEPFILNNGTSLIFGAGGTGKSMLALAMGLSVATGRTVFGRKPTRVGSVLYLDYEDSLDTHQTRLWALMQGMEIDMDDLEGGIDYLKPRQSVTKSRRDLLAIIRRDDPALIIVDSIGLARGGDATASEDTIRMFATLGSLGTAVLGIDHMTKEDRRSGKMVTPYGSIYTENSVRLAWSLRATDSSDDNNIHMNLIQTKRNNVARHDPMGAHIKFENEMIGFGPDGDIMQPVMSKVTLATTDVWGDSSSGTAMDKVFEYLEAHGNSSVPVMASALDLTGDTIRRAISRDKTNRIVKVSTNPDIWGLE